MVTRFFVLLYLLPSLLFGGEFTASVSRNQVGIGESFALTLTLSNTTAKSNPITGSLSNNFRILSQQQSNNTSIINGRISSSTSWTLILSSLKEGEVIIPPIKIDTNEGKLATQPIVIRVSKGQASISANNVAMAFQISNASPYKNEPFIYTIVVSSNTELSNIHMPKFTMDDAIVEVHGEPKVYHKIVNGISTANVEFSFLITPVKAGRLKIPSTVVEGTTPMESQASRRRSLFDDNFNPFFLMGSLDRLVPFVLETEEVNIDVLPQIPGIIPWLPARSLTIEEDKSTIIAQGQVGEPISRIFYITAHGLKSNQLQSLQDLQVNNENFKVYADKPELKDEIQEEQIISQRKEQYTLIPQQAGTLTLPEISVAWWDVINKEKKIAKIPARTIQVIAAATTVEPIQVAPASQVVEASSDALLYLIIGGLTFLLLGAIVWMIILQKKVSSIAQKPKQTSIKHDPFAEDKPLPPPKKSKKEELPDLNPT